MSIYWDAFKQCAWIPSPKLTEANLPNQAGRVFIVTGGYAGVGKELSKILYSKNGTVYVAGRSEDKAEGAIEEIKQATPSTDGRLEFLMLDLADLASIKGSVDDFLRREQRLDVLTNNAGVMTPPSGSKAAQGHELQMGTNVLGPYLFTQLLTPLLQKTAASSPPGSVRVTWAGSLATVGSPKNGVEFDEQSNSPKVHGMQGLNYGQSKAANVLLAKEYQTRYFADGIVSNAWNPGNLESELQRHQPWLMAKVLSFILYPAVYGAYTELYAGWSEEAGREEMKGAYYGPWGRTVMLRQDVENSPNRKRFWEWCEQEAKPYVG
ncbi:short-chain alcohol dehydrogenase [Vermiconidia calcicola]|uniref:Short-chain alcohol dehydrogenase n=1 Tax=Vermiconidia calcicola TaxID=1690605 RepID=A0ACC3NRA8_9PEZI|nr:short-chain alcohol dehydrogenase [Vermiconidia calcicola]